MKKSTLLLISLSLIFIAVFYLFIWDLYVKDVVSGVPSVKVREINNQSNNETITKSMVVTASKGSFSLTSDAGVDGGTLPTEYTGDGSGYSPALSWSNAPAGTREFALMMTTLPIDGKTKWNWVLYNIPGNMTCLVKNSSGVGVSGVGSHGSTMAYQPPHSQGPGTKLYTFTLYALSASPTLPAADQVTGEVLTEAISPITLGSASLNLSYTRPETNMPTAHSPSLLAHW